MVKLTKEQRRALYVKWCQIGDSLRPTYREFRKTVQPYYDGSGCVMVKWCGMWLGIETDGYTHS